jgi:hypothetical protein
MRTITLCSVLGASLLLCAGAADAQSTHGRAAASTWNDSWSPRSTDQQAVDIAIAEDQLRARRGGFGPATSNTYVRGDVNSYTTNNGPVNSSTAYNSGQSSTVNANQSGSGLSLTVTTGQTVGGDIGQDANAGVRIGSMTNTASSSQQGGGR